MPSAIHMREGSRLVAARARLLRAETVNGVALSFAAFSGRTTILVELQSADGRIGYGESWANFPAWAADERLATLRDGVFPLLIGEDARMIVALNSKLHRALEPIGRQWGAPGPIMQAISAVDLALWDLEGKRQARSIADLIGRVRSSIPVYASGIGPDDAGIQAARCRAARYGAIKVRVGFDRSQDEANLRAARAGGGDSMRLYADANQAWTLDEALAIAPTLIDLGIAWVEEPIRGNRLDDLETFHRRTGLDVATGENIYGRASFATYCSSPAIRVIQPDVTKAGGLTEALAICQIAQSEGKEVMPHFYGGAVGLAATLQLAGSAPNIMAIEYDIRENPLRDPIWRGGPIQLRGAVALPTGAGLGIDLDQIAVDRYARAQTGVLQ